MPSLKHPGAGVGGPAGASHPSGSGRPAIAVRPRRVRPTFTRHNGPSRGGPREDVRRRRGHPPRRQTRRCLLRSSTFDPPFVARGPAVPARAGTSVTLPVVGPRRSLTGLPCNFGRRSSVVGRKPVNPGCGAGGGRGFLLGRKLLLLSPLLERGGKKKPRARARGLDLRRGPPGGDQSSSQEWEYSTSPFRTLKVLYRTFSVSFDGGTSSPFISLPMYSTWSMRSPRHRAIISVS